MVTADSNQLKKKNNKRNFAVDFCLPVFAVTLGCMEPTASPRQPVEKMVARGFEAGARRKVKKEALEGEDAGCGSDLESVVACIACTARRLAVTLALSRSVVAGRTSALTSEADRMPSAAHPASSKSHVKTPEFSGKADWEVFHSQFELLARTAAWSDATKALQLAMCLTDDALACLLLLSPAKRDDYNALVGALQPSWRNPALCKRHWSQLWRERLFVCLSFK